MDTQVIELQKKIFCLEHTIKKIDQLMFSTKLSAEEKLLYEDARTQSKLLKEKYNRNLIDYLKQKGYSLVVPPLPEEEKRRLQTLLDKGSEAGVKDETLAEELATKVSKEDFWEQLYNILEDFYG